MSKKAQDWINRLNKDSVWKFTKQSTNFTQAYLSTKLLVEMPKATTESVEEYFRRKHTEYGIETDRHRTLIIAQILGLLTKTPFFERGGQYIDESPTSVFSNISKYDINSEEYNEFVSEQLIKLRIKSHTDSTNGDDFEVYPVIKIYMILAKLLEEHSIKYVSLDLFYTYIATSKGFNDIDEVVEILSTDPPPCEFVSKYKSDSRILTLITSNINLFIVKDNKISINEIFKPLFDGFLKTIDLSEIIGYLGDDNAYAYYLYFNQGFKINLIDKPSLQKSYLSTSGKTGVFTGLFIEETMNPYDEKYVEEIDNINEESINVNQAKNAHLKNPQKVSISKKFKMSKNPIIGKIAIMQSDYQCQVDQAHSSFISKRNKKRYMEAHHIIPVRLTEEIWIQKRINIDCIENIVSLCPNCHKAIHLGEEEEVKQLLHKLHKTKETEWESINLNVSIEELWKYYRL